MTQQAPGTGTRKPVWQKVLGYLKTFVDAATPIADMVAVADPALAPAIDLGERLLQAVIAQEPTAVAFWKQIQSGNPPTEAELTQWAADYEASYQRLKKDIAAQLAKLPPGA